MTLKSTTCKLLAALIVAVAVPGCGQLTEQGRSPVVVSIQRLDAAPGSATDQFGGVLLSDVLTNGTVYNDVGRVQMFLVLKDPGSPGINNAPSPLNSVTFTRYHVQYIRADGRNTPGVDVPYPFDSAATFTVLGQGAADATFEIVRHVAKLEAPLAALVTNAVVITTIAEITFYGRDLAGNDVKVVGRLQVNFGNFADPIS